MNARSTLRAREGGFTLIEVILVVTIAAVLAGLSIKGFRSLRKADLREASAEMAGAMRYLFDRASTTGKVHRLVIDMETRMYWAEVSDDHFFIPREETEQDMRRREEKEGEEDQDDAKKRELAAREAERGKGPAAGSSFDLSKLEPAAGPLPLSASRAARSRFLASSSSSAASFSSRRRTSCSLSSRGMKKRSSETSAQYIRVSMSITRRCTFPVVEARSNR